MKKLGDARDPLVSVIVPTRNSARTLRECLASLSRQTHQRLEVTVVDNYSSDETRAIAMELGAHVLTFGPERSAQRNFGGRRAGGDYLLFIDSDMVLEPPVVEECVAAARRRPTIAIIPEVSFGDGFWARCRRLERQCYVGDDDIEAARFFPRDIFLQLGGYDEQLNAGEDWDLSSRARASGVQTARVEARVLHDEGRLRLSELLAKKFRYGKSLPLYWKKHPELGTRQFRLVRPAFIRNRRLLLGEPGTLAGMAVMKTLEFAAGAAGAATALAVRRRSVRTARRAAHD